MILTNYEAFLIVIYINFKFRRIFVAFEEQKHKYSNNRISLFLGKLKDDSQESEKKHGAIKDSKPHLNDFYMPQKTLRISPSETLTVNIQKRRQFDGVLASAGLRQSA